MSRKHFKVNDAIKEIMDVTKRAPKSWGTIACKLDEISKEFEAISDESFSEFIENFSEEINIKPPMLWRYLMAGRAYQKLLVKMDNRHKMLSLEEIQDQPSADTVEILDKFSRVLPDAEYLDLAKEVLELKLKRDVLREIWSAIRPLLAEKETKRGRGRKSLEFNQELIDSRVYEKSKIIFNIMKNRPNILLGDQIKKFIYFSNDEYKNFDFVAVGRSKTNILTFHGIKIVEDLDVDFDTLERYKKYCNVLWLAFPEFLRDSPSEIKHLQNFNKIWASFKSVDIEDPDQTPNSDVQPSGLEFAVLDKMIPKGRSASV